MTHHAFNLANANLQARPDGTLWWPGERLLCVSDLHLGKSERIARRGGTLLPPYETRETLWRLDAAVSATDPATVICLGDSFDDHRAARAVSDDTRTTLTRLQAGRDWVWIEGNHDPGPIDLGGRHLREFTRHALTFRHIADPSIPEGQCEISGHFHPKVTIPGAGSRSCFLSNAARLILPAFGAYTGGLSARDPVLSDIMGPDAIAILTGKRALPVPVAACAPR